VGSKKCIIQVVRIVFLTNALLHLSGCAPDDIDKLKTDNKELKKANYYLRIENEENARRIAAINDAYIQEASKQYVAEIRRERQAGIAAGCDYIIPLCPHDMAAAGREVLKSGEKIHYESSYFYAFVFGKIGVLVIIVYLIWALYFRIHMPARQKVIDATNVIEDAKVAMKVSQTQLEANKNELRNIEEQIGDLRLIKEELESKNDFLREDNLKKEAKSAAIIQEHRMKMESEKQRLRELEGIMNVDISTSRKKKKTTN
jgi:hypothetical protein